MSNCRNVFIPHSVTHDCLIWLGKVPMDSESAKIKDLFLEVLQPLVNRLCGFGVFYSKEAARVRYNLLIRQHYLVYHLSIIGCVLTIQGTSLS